MTKDLPRTALVLGGSLGVWPEAERALELFTPDAVIAVNDMIALWPGQLAHACSLHPESLRKWQDAREAAGYNTDYQTVALEKPRRRRAGDPKIDLAMEYRWPHLGGGSSGLYGVKIMMDLDFDKIVLAGIPMTVGAGHVVRGPEHWDAAIQFRDAWIGAISRLRGRVKSMSGWTREILGTPDRAWLDN